MTVANLHETIVSHAIRRNYVTLEINQLQSQKTLVMRSQADTQTLKNAQIGELRDYFKELFENDPELQAKYSDYTEIPEFEEEMEKINAKIQEELDNLTAWETDLDAEITTKSTEIQELDAWKDSFKNMLSNNIQEEFNFGLNG